MPKGRHHTPEPPPDAAAERLTAEGAKAGARSVENECALQSPWGSRRVALTLALLGCAALTVILSVFGAWTASGYLSERRMAHLQEQAKSEADTAVEVAAAIIRQSLSFIRNIPAVIADEPATIEQLERFGLETQASTLPCEERQRLWTADEGLRTLARRLARVIAIENSGINACWVMNATGDTVAAGVMPGTPDFTGQNYADRRYFQRAAQGAYGSQFIVGRVTKVPGLFFCSPVRQGERLLGAVAVRADLEGLDKLLAHNAYVTDRYGVVIACGNPAIKMNAVANGGIDALDAATREARYQRKDFQPLDVALSDAAPSGQQGGPAYVVQSSLPVSLGPEMVLTVHAYRLVGKQDDIRQERLRTFGLLAAVTLLVVACLAGVVFFVCNSRRHRRLLVCVNEKLLHHARTDPLTGCANRRMFLETLEAELQRQLRHGQPFSVMSIDLDHFKQINDRFGHIAGDHALRHFVATTQAGLRPTDLLGRLGGEEFCILLGHTTAENAMIVAERIRATVEASPAALGATPIPMTISIGVAQWDAVKDQGVDDILARADTLLYEAKKAGRNTVRGDRRLAQR